MFEEAVSEGLRDLRGGTEVIGRPHARPRRIEATREVTGAAPNTRVLVVTTFEQDDYVFGAPRAGPRASWSSGRVPKS